MGTYRVIYVLDEEQHTVEVVAVVARSDAYRSPG
jgi:mRNA-degrading endonuclease RelE of RelBE toxin-antitoxin system